MLRNLFKALLVSIPVLGFLRLVVDVALHPEKFQWDFQVHYEAAKLYFSGQNPYELTSFVFLPISMWFFYPLTWFSYSTAYLLILGFKVVCVFLLFWIWKKYFLKENWGLSFFIFCLLAFYSTLHLDFRAGNVTVIEQFFLWIGFVFFLARKFLWFSVFVICAACFKILPAFFLILLLFTGKPRAFFDFLRACLAMVLIFVFSYYMGEEMIVKFLATATQRVGEGGVYSPSTLAFIRDSMPYFMRLNLYHPYLPLILYLSVCAAVIAISSLLIKKLKSPFEFIVLACFVFALILPRFKDYSYALLLVPAFCVLKEASKKIPSFFPFCLIFILSPKFVPIPPWFNHVAPLFWEYYPLFLAYFAWGLLVWLKCSERTNIASDWLSQ